MGSAFSLNIPIGFGTMGGIDRSKLHDKPWIETLKQLGRDRFFELNPKTLEELVQTASDEELHCLRAFFRGYRQYCAVAKESDDKDFSIGVYFTVTLQPQYLVLFYTMCHQCWLHNLVLSPKTEYGTEFVSVCAQVYAREKGEVKEEEKEDVDCSSMLNSMNEILQTFLDSVADLTSNPQFQDPIVATVGTCKFGEVHLYTLTASDGSIQVQISDFGATIMSCKVRNGSGEMVEVTRPYATIEECISDKTSYRGSTVGRYASRIENACYKSGDEIVRIDANEGQHHVHGGSEGFSHRLWRAIGEDVVNSSGSKQAFFLDSPDGDMGFPGRLLVRVEFSVSDKGGLAIRYNAQLLSNAKHPSCPVNLTNHTYWCLGGVGESVSHCLWTNCDKMVKLDAGIAKGEVLSVEGTALDFREEKRLGTERIDACLCVCGFRDGEIAHVATLYSPESRIEMRVSSSEPGLVVYSDAKTGVCLEMEKFPNSPNVASFPSCWINDEVQYAQLTVHQFSVRK